MNSTSYRVDIDIGNKLILLAVSNKVTSHVIPYNLRSAKDCIDIWERIEPKKSFLPEFITAYQLLLEL